MTFPWNFFFFLQINTILPPAFVFPHALFLFIYALSSFASIKPLFLSSKVHKDKGMWLYLFIASWGAFSSVTAFSLHQLQGFMNALLTLKSMYFSGYWLPFSGGDFALPSVFWVMGRVCGRRGRGKSSWSMRNSHPRAQKPGLKPWTKITRSKCICPTHEHGNRMLHGSAWLLKTSLSPFSWAFFWRIRNVGTKPQPWAETFTCLLTMREKKPII